MERLHLLLN